MDCSAFRDIKPDDIMLALAFGAHKQYWDEIILNVSEVYPAFSQEWKYYGKAWGWSFVLKSKTKTLCYLTPAKECFQVSVIFNDSGRALVAAADLPKAITQAVEAAKDNPKNIPYDLDIKKAADVDIAKKLIEARSKT